MAENNKVTAFIGVYLLQTLYTFFRPVAVKLKARLKKWRIIFLVLW